jgi:hypothetical protein
VSLNIIDSCTESAPLLALNIFQKMHTDIHPSHSFRPLFHSLQPTLSFTFVRTLLSLSLPLSLLSLSLLSLSLSHARTHARTHTHTHTHNRPTASFRSFLPPSTVLSPKIRQEPRLLALSRQPPSQACRWALLPMPTPQACCQPARPTAAAPALMAVGIHRNGRQAGCEWIRPLRARMQ